eukprot:TRINITY_DN1732_c0_g1_i1.p1 TRINITY_DN1732_c0_g1~~TRINITY_DN1732_c0_g1_i1.p1  ORF type:complete len:239 (+),score=42.69 TRINITY_DN1732_c0_g1_i1:66-782(+)
MMDNQNKSTIHIVGYKGCSYFENARKIGESIGLLSDKYTVDIQQLESSNEYKNWLSENKNSLPNKEHKTSPIVWKDEDEYIGGFDKFLLYVKNLIFSSKKKPNETKEFKQKKANRTKKFYLVFWPIYFILMYILPFYGKIVLIIALIAVHVKKLQLGVEMGTEVGLEDMVISFMTVGFIKTIIRNFTNKEKELVKPNEAAIDCELFTLDGETVQLSELWTDKCNNQSKMLVLNFGSCT